MEMPMNRLAIASLLCAITLGQTAAFAQPAGPDAGPDHRQQEGPGKPRNAGPEARGHDDARRPVPHQDWHSGDRLPDSYRGSRYVVKDWRAHDLHAPPSGYQWVQVNGDFVLAAIATGVISSIIVSSH
jgi:Ni/Co efflux regulator RcnB